GAVVQDGHAVAEQQVHQREAQRAVVRLVPQEAGHVVVVEDAERQVLRGHAHAAGLRRRPPVALPGRVQGGHLGRGGAALEDVFVDLVLRGEVDGAVEHPVLGVRAHQRVVPVEDLAEQ
ncbi:MAG: hypothetical protein ACK559_12565, partial [bacterium]